MPNMTQGFLLYNKEKLILLNLVKSFSGATKGILAQLGQKGFAYAGR